MTLRSEVDRLSLDAMATGIGTRGRRRLLSKMLSLAIVLAVPSMVALVAGPAEAATPPPLVTSQAIANPLGAGFGNIQLNATSCPTTAWCAGVGTYGTAPVVVSNPPSPSAAYAEVFSLGRWQNTVLPLPPGGTSVVMNGISCPTMGICVAVGWWFGSSNSGSVIETLSNSTWNQSVTPFPGYLDAISCPAIAMCVGVGGIAPTPNGSAPMLATLTGSTWTNVPITGSLKGHFSGVSCPTTSECVAVGGDDGGGDGAYVDSLQAGDWTVSPIASPEPLFPSLVLTSVSCPSASFCAAAGIATGYDAKGGPTISTFSGGTWSTSLVDTPPGTGSSGLNGISCGSSTFCVAGGWASGLGTSSSFLDIYSNGQWSPSAISGVSIYNGASCGSTTNCLLVGTESYSAAVATTAVIPTQGYWMVGGDGGVFSFGLAPFFGSTGNLTLNRPVVGMAPTSDRLGYWFVAGDGGIFSFGDAQFHGSTGNLTLNRPVVGMAATPDGKGYWIVASDGGVFTFGDAQFYGSAHGTATATVVGIATTSDGRGYRVIGADGAVFAFGDADFYGSVASVPLNRPVVGGATQS